MTNKEQVLEAMKMAVFQNPAEMESGGIAYHKDHWGYVLDGQGELYTGELAKRLRSMRYMLHLTQASLA